MRVDGRLAVDRMSSDDDDTLDKLDGQPLVACQLTRPMGLGLTAKNAISELHEAGSAWRHGGLDVGDRIVRVDGVHVLDGCIPLAAAIDFQATSHRLIVAKAARQPPAARRATQKNALAVAPPARSTARVVVQYPTTQHPSRRLVASALGVAAPSTAASAPSKAEPEPAVGRRCAPAHALRAFNCAASADKGVAAVRALGVLGAAADDEDGDDSGGKQNDDGDDDGGADADADADDGEALAAFFWRNDGKLDQKLVGEYIGGGGAEHATCRAALLGRLRLQGLPLDSAMRRLVALCGLPGEAQRIDRVIDAFAAVYAEQNHAAADAEAEAEADDAEADAHDGGSSGGLVGGFDCAETVQVVAFSLVMLHTDAHHAAIRRSQKMTRDQYVANLRGVGARGASLDEALLRALYERVTAAEWQVEERAHFAPVREGPLLLRLDGGGGGGGGGGGVGARRCHCVLSTRALYLHRPAQEEQGRHVVGGGAGGGLPLAYVMLEGVSCGPARPEEHGKAARFLVELRQRASPPSAAPSPVAAAAAPVAAPVAVGAQLIRLDAAGSGGEWPTKWPLLLAAESEREARAWIQALRDRTYDPGTTKADAPMCSPPPPASRGAAAPASADGDASAGADEAQERRSPAAEDDDGGEAVAPAWMAAGSTVEVEQSGVEGFEGARYSARVVPPGLRWGKGSAAGEQRLHVEYDLFYAAEESDEKLREAIDPARARPPPPRARPLPSSVEASSTSAGDGWLAAAVAGDALELRFEDGWWEARLLDATAHPPAASDAEACDKDDGGDGGDGGGADGSSGGGGGAAVAEGGRVLPGAPAGAADGQGTAAGRARSSVGLGVAAVVGLVGAVRDAAVAAEEWLLEAEPNEAAAAAAGSAGAPGAAEAAEATEAAEAAEAGGAGAVKEAMLHEVELMHQPGEVHRVPSARLRPAWRWHDGGGEAAATASAAPSDGAGGEAEPSASAGRWTYKLAGGSHQVEMEAALPTLPLPMPSAESDQAETAATPDSTPASARVAGPDDILWPPPMVMPAEDETRPAAEAPRRRRRNPRAARAAGRATIAASVARAAAAAGESAPPSSSSASRQDDAAAREAARAREQAEVMRVRRLRHHRRRLIDAQRQVGCIMEQLLHSVAPLGEGGTDLLLQLLDALDAREEGRVEAGALRSALADADGALAAVERRHARAVREMGRLRQRVTSTGVTLDAHHPLLGPRLLLALAWSPSCTQPCSRTPLLSAAFALHLPDWHRPCLAPPPHLQHLHVSQVLPALLARAEAAEASRAAAQESVGRAHELLAVARAERRDLEERLRRTESLLSSSSAGAGGATSKNGSGGAA